MELSGTSRADLIGSVCGARQRAGASSQIVSVLASGFLLSSCSTVPPLDQAAGDSHPDILIGNVVNRVKCELADSFADIWAAKEDDGSANKLKWLQDWTAKVDLTLQINDSAGVSPSGSRTIFDRNAFNYAAGSSSL